MTIYVVEFMRGGLRLDMRTFRIMTRMEDARREWTQQGDQYETHTTACFITDAEMKEAP